MADETGPSDAANYRQSHVAAPFRSCLPGIVKHCPIPSRKFWEGMTQIAPRYPYSDPKFRASCSMGSCIAESHINYEEMLASRCHPRSFAHTHSLSSVSSHNINLCHYILRFSECLDIQRVLSKFLSLPLALQECLASRLCLAQWAQTLAPFVNPGNRLAPSKQ